MWRLLLFVLAATADETIDKDGESSRKILGSSVVTSVSVIMDAGNGSKVYADAVGKPVSKPTVASDVASPIDLLSPDRYEFYTFDDTGDLVKRLMTLEEIHDIIATGDDELPLDSLTDGFVPEKRVNDVVNNVQNVLKEEIKQHKNPEKPQFDTPDVSDSWSMILPAVFGNSGDDINMEKPVKHVTPDTIMVEPTVMVTTEQISTTEKRRTTPGAVSTTTTTTTAKTPMINVEIITNSNSTTENTLVVGGDSQIVEIKPQHDEVSFHVSKSTKRPFVTRATTTTTTTTEAPKTTDNLEDASTVVEKVAPLETSTVAQTVTTEEMPVTMKLVSTTTTEEATTITQTMVPSTTTDAPTSMFSSVPPETTTEVSSTFAPVGAFFIVSNATKDDLRTESTEYFSTNKLPLSTTESQSTTLDQLLLSSTNIYEINSELSEVKSTTNFDETTTEEKFLIRLTNPTEPTTTTTDQTFIDTIEQLISQAVGTPAPPVESAVDATVVEEMILKSSNKTMPEVVAEAATVASKLVGNTEESTTTMATTTEGDLGLLSDSVGALLSQVVGEGLTTVESETTTEVTTAATTTTTSAPTTTAAATTTTAAVTTTTAAATTTTTAAATTTMTTAAPSTTTAAATTTILPFTTFIPHIINITIIRNDNRTQPKPAKSDLSLEKEQEDLFNEMKKNSSLTTVVPEDVTTTTEEVTEATTTELPEAQPSIVITISENKTDPDDSKWTLVSTVAPGQSEPPVNDPAPPQLPSVDPPPVDLVPKPLQGFGLEDSTARLDTDIYQFVQLCNELAFGFWKSVTTGVSAARSIVVSPFAATSLLAMVFLGARGATSGEMNEILKLDDMVTFNPHLIFKNVSESIESNPDSGVAVSAIVRELYSDRSKGKLLGFYKERVRQFYDGHVEEASFKDIGDTIRRRTNLLIKKHTDGKILEFLKDGSIFPKPPLAGVSVSLFQTDCSQGSTEGRDGELHFVVLPSLRQRRLIPIPATVYRSNFLAGYEPSLDATAAALGTKDQIVSTIFVIPGQQGMAALGDGLARLEKRLVESSFKKGAWSRLLRSLIPRPGLELQIPRFQHRSLVNATQSLKRMGLHELFDAHKADLKGLNGAAHDLHLSDVVQINEFATCGERRIGEAHHIELYPATTERKRRLVLEEGEEPRDYQRAFHDPLHDPSYLTLPLALRPRQARLPEAPRLRFDRPFLYFVRHNPSGLILHMGRFHPRLLP